LLLSPIPEGIMPYTRDVNLNFNNATVVKHNAPQKFEGDVEFATGTTVTIAGDLDFSGAQTFEELITAQKGITVSTVGVSVLRGDVTLSKGDLAVYENAGTGGNLIVEEDVTVQKGDLTVTLGDIKATAGNIEALAGRVIGAGGLSVNDLAVPAALHTITGDADANMLWDAKIVDAATYKRIEEFEISGSGAGIPLWTYVIPENTSVSVSGYIHCRENSAGAGVSANTGLVFSVRASDMAGYRYAGATGAAGAVALTQVDLIDNLVGASVDPVFSYTVAANGTFELAVDTGNDGAGVNNAFLMRGTLEVIEVPHA
jgi:hypothetical protein